jgi:hypothetical protein
MLTGRTSHVEFFDTVTTVSRVTRPAWLAGAAVTQPAVSACREADSDAGRAALRQFVLSEEPATGLPGGKTKFPAFRSESESAGPGPGGRRLVTPAPEAATEASPRRLAP